MIKLAFLLLSNKQLDAAENTSSRAIDLISGKGEEYLLCILHRVLGDILRSKGEKGKSIHHFNTALEIASPFNWNEELFWCHYGLADLFLQGAEFDNAQGHIERAKPYAVNNAYLLGRATHLQAVALYRQRRLKGAKSHALQAVEIYEKLGAARDAEYCRDTLQDIKRAMETQE